jgi:hypothetical protein
MTRKTPGTMVTFELDWEAKRTLESDPDKLREFKLMVNIDPDSNTFGFSPIVGVLEDVVRMIGPVKVLKVWDAVEGNLASHLMLIHDKLERLTSDTKASLNEKVHVHVGGFGLMLIDEVKVLEDFCTMELAKELEVGWKILAVCVQPDQRRPDYVVGRVKPKEC